MRIVLFQPDIPQNTGTILRMAACFGLAVDIIEPAGFNTSDRAFRRAGLDYLDQVDIHRHESTGAFEEWRRSSGHRLVLMTTRGDTPHHTFDYRPDDLLMFGRESAGVPERMHEAADARVVIPMRAGLRSLNVAISAAVVTAEAMRQTGLFDKEKS